MMEIPQTGRQPAVLSDEAVSKALKKRHPQDTVDYFATDPNPEIRTLGRMALRRNDINDLFALGDLCAKRSITEDSRLLVFYVGKTLIAYQKALKVADNPDDRKAARDASLNFTDWVIVSAREYPSRRNVAVALWAIGEQEPQKDPAVTLDAQSETQFDSGSQGEGNGYEEVIPELLEIYLTESPTGPVQPRISLSSYEVDLEERTMIAPTDLSGTVGDFPRPSPILG